MPNPLPLILMLLLAAPSAAAAEEPRELDGTVLAQLVIRERIIIRMSRSVAPRAPLPPSEVQFDEKKGPKCVPVRELAGSADARKEGVDLAIIDGSRLRARLDEDCKPLDFYAGFYIKRPPDGMLCAKRDVIRSRSGSACPILSFKKLKAKR